MICVISFGAAYAIGIKSLSDYLYKRKHVKSIHHLYKQIWIYQGDTTICYVDSVIFEKSLK